MKRFILATPYSYSARGLFSGGYVHHINTNCILDLYEYEGTNSRNEKYHYYIALILIGDSNLEMAISKEDYEELLNEKRTTSNKDNPNNQEP